MEKIILGGGCFWCLEEIFRRVPGVAAVTPGYAGGTLAQPTYEKVCSGTTGHAEVVEVEYDPSVIDTTKIIDYFFAAHDPTTPNRQGMDTGSQYRSIILYTSEGQKETLENILNSASFQKQWPQPVVTEVKRLEKFYPAEDYHRNYYMRHAEQPYCRVVIAPKLTKLFNDK
ncbi:peptide methionine sulfoxide reductase [Dehalogenimonas lykanthroporepellens BL-DC-9]|jgi:peptide-methionine (S)-S-oxide reductase|nr:peptide methionine sulfoxide reductase [Dehalogenimonas lykanthroporepellens BL-DC-9]